MKRKKPYKTIKETPTGRNQKSLNLNNLTAKQNSELIERAEKGNLSGYHVVKRKGQKKFLRSNPDPKKKNNLDPKINR
jgi:hypothetical protein